MRWSVKQMRPSKAGEGGQHTPNPPTSHHKSPTPHSLTFVHIHLAACARAASTPFAEDRSLLLTTTPRPLQAGEPAHNIYINSDDSTAHNAHQATTSPHTARDVWCAQSPHGAGSGVLHAGRRLSPHNSHHTMGCRPEGARQHHTQLPATPRQSRLQGQNASLHSPVAC